MNPYILYTIAFGLGIIAFAIFIAGTRKAKHILQGKAE